VVNIELGGLTAGTDHDQLAVSGAATLAGTLSVSLTGGFVPSSGNEFQVMTFASSTGTFDTLDLPPGFTTRIDGGTTLVLVAP
jgi:hypothetical protein